MSRLKLFAASFLLWIPLLFAGGSLVYSQSNKIIGDDICAEAPDSKVCDEFQSQGDEDPISGPSGIISTAANIIALIGGIAAVIIIIISGLMYVTAGGAAVGQRAGDSPNRAKKAQQTLMGAVIGLVIIALAWSITRFIIDRLLQ